MFACPYCWMEAKKFGIRNGIQRYRCKSCGKMFSDRPARMFGTMRLEPAKAIDCLRLLLEGNSIRSTQRLTGVDRNTIMALLLRAGRNCKFFLEKIIHKIPVNDVQADEIWSFIRCKERVRELLNLPEYFGDAYCFVALDRKTKLVLAWHLGRRSVRDTELFVKKLRNATWGRYQITTDGFSPYRVAIPWLLNGNVDFAQLVKVYASPREAEQRYSPAQVVDVIYKPVSGDPNLDLICTSHVERQNLTMRMQIRRFTRLTNGFSKKWQHHEAAIALWFAYYNFCRVHSSHKHTPAVAAGITGSVWSVMELMEKAATSSQTL